MSYTNAKATSHRHNPLPVNLQGGSSFGVLLWLCVVCVLLGCSPSDRADQGAMRVIHNNDGTDLLANAWFDYRPLSRADVNAYVDRVAGSQVTTFMICAGSDYVFYRSAYCRPFGDEAQGRYGCADSATRATMRRYYDNFIRLEEEGTDLIETSLLRAQEQGMEAFISFRINDLHFADTAMTCPMQCPDFWLEHPEYWMRDTTQGWHSTGALDMAIAAVREYKMNLIKEQLERYEMIDGYELDFMRFPVYFKAGEGRENAHLLTEMVSRTRALVDSLSEVRGKEILLSVRVPMSVETGLEKGIDIREWARLGLVDFVSIGAHWRGEVALPMAQFKRDLNHPEIPVYGVIDDGGYRPRECFSHGALRAMASSILGQGGDGVYLFNYYFGEYNTQNRGAITLSPSGELSRTIDPALLQELGSLQTLRGRNKIYAVSDGVSGEYLMRQYTALPLVVTAEKCCEATLFVADSLERETPEQTLLFVRTDRSVALNSFALFVGGVRLEETQAEAVELYDQEQGLRSGDRVYAWVIPAGALTRGENRISFVTKDDATFFVVRRLEVALRYGDVATHGYF